MTEEERPSGTGRHGAYIGDRPYDSSDRIEECGEDDACEGLRAIEIQFAIPVTMTQDRQKQLHDWVEALVYEPFNQPKEGVHWPGFVGGGTADVFGRRQCAPWPATL